MTDSRRAVTAAKKNQQQRPLSPHFARKQFGERSFNADRILLFRKSKDPGKPHNVRVHHNSIDHPEELLTDDVRGLAPYSGQGLENFHVLRHAACMVCEELLAEPFDMPCLVAEKAC